MKSIDITTRGFRIVLESPPPPAPAWYDLPGQSVAAAEALTKWLADKAHHCLDVIGDYLEDVIGVMLPTAACIGILWWMVPFLPKSDNGPRLTGAALILYMFYALIRGGGA